MTWAGRKRSTQIPRTREEIMIENFEIRKSTPDDLQDIEALYLDAFPDEDLLPLVRNLLKRESDVLSLVGTTGASLIAHLILTTCSIDNHQRDAALLGPLAVASDHQRKGAGSLIVNRGMQQLQDNGIRHVFVLGDPAYYGRFGFSTADKVTPPYPLPPEWNDAWQAMTLGAVNTPAAGAIHLPEPWLRKELWST